MREPNVHVGPLSSRFSATFRGLENSQVNLHSFMICVNDDHEGNAEERLIDLTGLNGQFKLLLPTTAMGKLVIVPSHDRDSNAGISTSTHEFAIVQFLFCRVPTTGRKLMFIKNTSRLDDYTEGAVLTFKDETSCTELVGYLEQYHSRQIIDVSDESDSDGRLNCSENALLLRSLHAALVDACPMLLQEGTEEMGRAEDEGSSFFTTRRDESSGGTTPSELAGRPVRCPSSHTGSLSEDVKHSSPEKRWQEFLAEYGPPKSALERSYWHFIVQLSPPMVKEVIKYNVFSYLRRYAHREPLQSGSMGIGNRLREPDPDSHNLESDSSMLGPHDFLGMASEESSCNDAYTTNNTQREFSPRQIRRARFKCANLLLGMLKQGHGITDEPDHVNDMEGMVSKRSSFHYPSPSASFHSTDGSDYTGFDPLALILGKPLQQWLVATFISVRISDNEDVRFVELFASLAKLILDLTATSKHVDGIGSSIQEIVTCDGWLESCGLAWPTGLDGSTHEELSKKIDSCRTALKTFKESQMLSLLRPMRVSCLTPSRDINATLSPQVTKDTSGETDENGVGGDAHLTAEEPTFPSNEGSNAIYDHLMHHTNRYEVSVLSDDPLEQDPTSIQYGAFLVLMSNEIDVSTLLDQWIHQSPSVHSAAIKMSYPGTLPDRHAEAGLAILSKFHAKMKRLVTADVYRDLEDSATRGVLCSFTDLTWSVIHALAPMVSFMEGLYIITFVTYSPPTSSVQSMQSMWTVTPSVKKFAGILAQAKSIMLKIFISRTAFNDLLRRCLYEVDAMEFLRELIDLSNDIKKDVHNMPMQNNPRAWTAECYVDKFSERFRHDSFMDAMLLILHGHAPSVHRARLLHLEGHPKMSSTRLRYLAIYLICGSWKLNSALLSRVLSPWNKGGVTNPASLRANLELRCKEINDEILGVSDYLTRMMLSGIPAVVLGLVSIKTPEALYIVSDFVKSFFAVNTLYFDPLEFIGIVVGPSVMQHFLTIFFGKGITLTKVHQAMESDASDETDTKSIFEDLKSDRRESLFETLIELATTKMNTTAPITMDVDVMDERRRHGLDITHDHNQTLVAQIKSDIESTTNYLLSLNAMTEDGVDDSSMVEPRPTCHIGIPHSALVPRTGLAKLSSSDLEDEIRNGLSPVTQQIRDFHSLAGGPSETLTYVAVQEVYLDLIQHVCRIFPSYTFDKIVETDMPLRLLEMAIMTTPLDFGAHGSQKTLTIESLKIFKQYLQWLGDRDGANFIREGGLRPLIYLVANGTDSPLGIGDGSVVESMILACLSAIFMFEHANNSNVPSMLGRAFFTADSAAISGERIDESSWHLTLLALLECHETEIEEIVHQDPTSHLNCRLRRVLQQAQLMRHSMDMKIVELERDDEINRANQISDTESLRSEPHQTVQYHKGRRIQQNEEDWMMQGDDGPNETLPVDESNGHQAQIEALNTLIGDNSAEATDALMSMRHNELELPSASRDVTTSLEDESRVDESDFLALGRKPMAASPSKLNLIQNPKPLKLLLSSSSMSSTNNQPSFTDSPSSIRTSLETESNRSVDDGKNETPKKSSIRDAWATFLLKKESSVSKHTRTELELHHTKRAHSDPDSLSDSEPDRKRRKSCDGLAISAGLSPADLTLNARPPNSNSPSSNSDNYEEP